MDIASQLLRDTDLPVREIALALHYADASAFTKAFRARVGASPRAWREAAAGGAGTAAARTAAPEA
jgi:AraC-like DNA-binding protein